MGIFSVFGKSNTVYFPGCTTYYKFPDNFELYKKIFLKLGIDFRIIEKKICCGLPALESGYEKEARKIARRNFEIFKEEQITSVLTNSPEAYKMFSEDYPILLPDWNIEVLNLWDIIFRKLRGRPRLIKNKTMETVTYHDSCYLSRYMNVYNEPRKILESIGYEVKEMNDFKKDSMCCGSCGGLPRTNPALAKKIAKERVLQAKRLGVVKIIVASMENYALMKPIAVENGMQVLELSEVLAYALNIKARPTKPSEEEIEGEKQILQETAEEEIIKPNIEVESSQDNKKGEDL